MAVVEKAITVGIHSSQKGIHFVVFTSYEASRCVERRINRVLCCKLYEPVGRQKCAKMRLKTGCSLQACLAAFILLAQPSHPQDVLDLAPGSVLSVISLGQQVTEMIFNLWTEFSPENVNNVESYPALDLGRDRKVLKKFQQVTERLDALDVTLLGIVLRNSSETYARPVWALYERWQQYLNISDELEKSTLEDLAESVVSHHPESVHSLLWQINNLVIPPWSSSFRKGIFDHLDDLLQEALRSLHDVTPATVRWETQFDTLQTYARPVWALYERWQQYLNISDELEKSTLEDLAESVVSHHPESVHSLLWQINNLVIPPWSSSFRKGIFDHLDDLLQNLQEICDLNQTAQQYAYGLYKLIAATETKGFAMTQFSWILLREYGKGSYMKEAALALRAHDERVKGQLEVASRVVRNLSTSFWRCDPHEHVENKTFTAVTELLQGYIENEVDMNREGSCTQTCSDFGNSFPAKRESCFENPKQRFCNAQRTCNGRIFDCQFVNADAWVCLSPKPYRRYGYVEYEDGQLMGSKSNVCIKSQKVDSWWRWFVHCSYCFCLCDDASPTSHRYFSLREVVSDVENGKVVTGVKLEQIQGIVHVRIQQSKALPGLDVHLNHEWKKVNHMRVEEGLENEDYMKLTWEERALDFDDIVAPKGHVVTGVKFRKLGGHLGLAIKVTPVQFDSGRLMANESYWMFSTSTEASETDPRSELLLEDVDLPTKSPIRSTIDSLPNQFVNFGPTSRRKDAAQTTIPFLDIQDVAPTGLTWLKGIGLYHKGYPGYGGYVGLRVFTWDIGEYMHLPPAALKTPKLLGYDIIY
ncbi:unnamed protein product [Notodromas monacha]|uniref:Uncharacterized protein n=1 Tax=Notodromas monacha TaxID=399045 RepID=A0A7R9BLS7_9CRUS|nr:unnamed protein product [Notodromas monacha]CAG0917566.1 unnamed protein product [Notodromas monacha]